MKKLAIRGHSTRGNEVIELLEMLGGKNIRNLDGSANMYSYYICNDIILSDRLSIAEDDDFEIFTLQGFLEEYPFKVGDKVIDGCGNKLIIKSMSWSEDCRTMVYDFEDSVIVLAAEDIEFVDDNKLSGTVGNNSIDSSQFMQLGKIAAVCFNTTNYENEVELQLDDYEIVVRDDKTYAVRKKPKYPKTYEECCDIIECCKYTDFKVPIILPYDAKIIPLLENIRKLLICRDTYWDIAGEKLGLGKLWEPDWCNEDKLKYCIECSYGTIDKTVEIVWNCILSFPTEEMRDAFYENFKDLIEQCKELL